MPPKKAKHDDSLRRINLCFDITDARQKVVYEYLVSMQKKKTKAVVDFCLQGMNASGCAQIPANSADVQQEAIIQRVEKLLSDYEERLGQRLAGLSSATPVVSVAPSQKPEVEKSPITSDVLDEDDYDDNMSDDAFSDMMALSGLY